MNLHDPTGLEPIPVEVMTEYIRRVKNGDIQRDALNKFWEDVKHKWNRFWSSSIDDWNKFWEDFLKDPVGWINSHPEELRNGAVMILSVMMLGTPLSPFAVGYLGGVGTSWIIQRWENGKIDPRQLQIDGLIGAGSEALFMLIGRVYRVVRSGKGVEFNTSGGRLSIPGQAPSSMAKFDTRLVGAAESKILHAGESGFYTRLKPGDTGYGILKSPARELQETRYPKIEVKPVAGGARSATEVPPVAVSRVDVPQVAPVEGSGASRGASQVPVKPVEAPQVGEVPPASGAGSGAAGMQAVKPGGVADDAVAARGSAGVREPEVQLKPVEEAKVEGLPPTAKGKDTEVPKDLESPQPTPSKNVTPNQGWQTEAIERGIHPSLVQGEQVARDALGIERDGLSHVQYDKVNNVYYENPQQVTNALGKWEKNKDVHGTVIRGPENPYPRLRIFDDTLAPADYTTAPMGGPKTKLNYSITPVEKFTGRIPQEATDLARYTWSEEIPDRGIRVFKNKDLKTKEKILPDKTINGDNIRYFEIDVRDAGYIMRDEPRLPVKRDNERLVVGSNGDIYYTPNHYKDFVLLRRS